MKNIKTFEGFADWFKSKEQKAREEMFSTKNLSLPTSTYHWSEQEKKDMESLQLKYKGEVNMMGCFTGIDFEGGEFFIVKKSEGHNGYEGSYYEVIINNKPMRYDTISDIKIFLNKYYS